MAKAICVTGFEDAFLVIEGEGFGRRFVGIADDWNSTAGKGLDAGDAFDLIGAGVHVEVSVVKDFTELLRLAEFDDERVREFDFFRESLVLFLILARTTKDDLNVIVVTGFGDRFDDEILPLLVGEPPYHRDDEFALKLFRFFDFDWVEEIGNAIRDDVVLVFEIAMVL